MVRQRFWSISHLRSSCQCASFWLSPPPCRPQRVPGLPRQGQGAAAPHRGPAHRCRCRHHRRPADQHAPGGVRRHCGGGPRGPRRPTRGYGCLAPGGILPGDVYHFFFGRKRRPIKNREWPQSWSIPPDMNFLWHKNNWQNGMTIARMG